MMLFPCPHDNYSRNFQESYDRLKVRISYENHTHHVYNLDAGTAWCDSYAAQSFSNPLNPFCRHCKTDVINDYSSNFFSDYLISDINKVFETLQESVCVEVRLIQQLKHEGRQCGSNTKLKDGRVYFYDHPVTRHRHLFHSDPLELYSYFWNWDGADTQPRPTPASKLAIEELERVEVTADHGGNEAGVIEEDCVVCLEGLAKKAAGAVVVLGRLPCEYVFHEECVVQWLRTSHFCPLCRFELPVETSE